MWHKTDLYAEEFKPDSIKMPFRPWIFENDAEKVAIQKVRTPESLFNDISLIIPPASLSLSFPPLPPASLPSLTSVSSCGLHDL
jgi:hypothetical protein